MAGGKWEGGGGGGGGGRDACTCSVVGEEERSPKGS